VFWLEQTVWLAEVRIDLPVYDFPFETYFACRRPYERPDRITAIARFGAASNYLDLYRELLAEGIQLVHTPEQYLRASELTHWYPLLTDLTPRSMIFPEPPTVDEITSQFEWPVFIKGSRQTSKHKAALSIAHSAEDCERVLEHYRKNPILHWQALVCREFVPLRPVLNPVGDTIPPSFEFRSFWWCGQCVGVGPYWVSNSAYSWTPTEQAQAMSVAGEAARRVNVPFLVVDVAQTIEGRWIVIECNDAQESGYAGVNPLGLWQRLLEIERDLTT
jgi:hypothetical protein